MLIIHLVITIITITKSYIALHYALRQGQEEGTEIGGGTVKVVLYLHGDYSDILQAGSTGNSLIREVNTLLWTDIIDSISVLI